MTAVVVSTNFTLVLGNENPNSPVIGINNQLTAANVTATDSASGFPASNLGNPSTFERWKANSTGTKYLTCVLTGANEINYVGLAAHNFGTEGVQISVEVDDGSGYAEIIEPFLVPDDRPLFMRFAGNNYVGVRVKLVTTSIAQCAVMYVGKYLPLQRNIYVGHPPINLNRNRNVITGMSESANFLGRITTGRTASTSIALQNLTPGWYRSYMDPFLEAAETRPFFFAWRPQGYPREVGFCWITGNPTPKNQRPNGMMQVDLQLGGLVQ